MEAARFAAALGLSAVLYPIRRLLLRLNAEKHWVVAPILDVRLLVAVSAAALAWTAPTPVGLAVDHAGVIWFAFLAGWVGLVAGCGLDLRVLRRHTMTSLLYELGLALVTCAGVALTLVAVAHLLRADLSLLQAPALLMASAMCVAGAALPLGQEGNVKPGARRRTWRTMAPFLGVVLAALGSGLVATSPMTISPVWSSQALLFTIEGLGNRLWWGLVAGAMTGLLCDLATREDFPLGGLYFLLAGVLLTGSGMALILGLEPLWLGAVAGAWLMNATLRRLDVMRVLDQGSAATRIGLPLLTGWLLGRGMQDEMPDPVVFALTLVLVLGFGAAVKSVGTRLALRRLSRGGRRGMPLPNLTRMANLDDVAIVIAVVLSGVVSAAEGLGVLAAVILGQVVLGLASAWAGRALPAQAT